MSPVDLHRRLAELRRRVRQIVLVRGVSTLAIVIVGALLVEGGADWLLHFDDPLVRLIFVMGLGAGAAWVAYRRLVAPLGVDFADVELAQWIERRHPELADGLASSVQFSSTGSDPRLGSPELQQAVISSTLRRIESIDCTDVVDSRVVRKTAGVALGLMGLAALVALIDRQSAVIAVRRFLLPFSSQSWPRRTNLVFLNENLDPLFAAETGRIQLVRGDALKIIVKNRTGRLPNRVRMETRFVEKGRTADSNFESLRPTTLKSGDGVEHEVAVGRIVAGKSDLEFRAVGGDDEQMAWQRLEVVAPPVIARLQVTITPPAYSRRAVETLPAGVGHVTGLVGSLASIVAETAQPISAARLHVGESAVVEAALSENGTRLETSFRITQPGTHAWWIELIDTVGFTDADPPHFEVRGLPDAEPEIFIDRPSADLQATEQATIQVRTTARDDLGLKSIRLVAELEADGKKTELSIPLYAELNSNEPERSLEKTVECQWNLAELSLAPGARISYYAEATDEFDLSAEYPDGPAFPPHVGRSAVRSITIVSPTDKAREMAQRREAVAADLERAQKLEQQARSQIDDLVAQLKNVQEPRAEDREALQRTEMLQREITAQIAGSAGGLAQRAAEFVDELRNNKLDDPRSQRRFERLASELTELGERELAPLDRQLTEARKLLQTTNGGAKKGEPAALLGQASNRQRAVADALNDMVQELSQWKSESDAAGEATELVRRQADLNRRAAEAAARTLTIPVSELSPQDRADLAKIAEGQKRQAEQLEQLESRMRAQQESLAETDPAAAALLKEAADQLQRQGTAGRMRDASEQIAANRMGQAAGQQQEALNQLRELEEKLRPSRESDTETLVKKLKAAEKELAAMSDKQADLLKKTAEAQQQTDEGARADELQRLGKEQRQLRDEAAQMARRLSRLEAEKAGGTLHRAAERMEQALEKLEKLEKRDEAGAEKSQQEALDDIEQARRELSNDRREQEETLAAEQIVKLADQLKALGERQMSALVETQRLENLRAKSGSWNRPQLAALRDVAKVQQELTAEAQQLVEQTSVAEVLALVLKGAARSMREAAEKLENRDAGDETQKEQLSAARRLAAILTALKEDPQTQQPDAGDDSNDGGSGDSDGEHPPELIPGIAQIKLLIALQQDLLERTEQLDRLRDGEGKLPASAMAELEAIVREQGEIADLFRGLAHSIDDGSDPETGGGAEEAVESPQRLPEKKEAE